MEKKKQPPKKFGQKVSLRQDGIFLDFFNKKKCFLKYFPQGSYLSFDSMFDSMLTLNRKRNLTHIRSLGGFLNEC